MRTSLKSIVATVAMIWAACPATQAANLIVNGVFENGQRGQLGYLGSLSSWTSSGPGSGGLALNILMGTTFAQAGFSTQTQVPPVFATLTIAGPDNGNSNGFTGSNDGGNFLGAQVGAAVGPLSQTVSGLTIGNQYEVTFEWASASLTTTTAPTSSGWSILFGSESTQTGNTAIPTKGFNNWAYFNYTFTATSTSQSLAFQPTGTGTGGFALLDNVRLNDVTVPEPSTYALGAIAAGVMAMMARRRRVPKTA